MVFEIEKPRRYPRLLYFKQHFDTEEVILQQPREQKRQQNRADPFPLQKNEVGQSVTSYLNKTAVAVASS